MELLLLLYSPVWMSVVAATVLFGWYEHLSAAGYVLLGIACALPCVLLPLAWPGPGERRLPFYQRYSIRVNVWVAILSFVGNYFITHYFYSVLSMRYTVPVGPWSLNAVPLCMYLLTHPYFCSYHILATVIQRRLGLLSPNTSQAVRSSAVLLLSYTTAFLETWSISAFPHYTYPDPHQMYTVGSAFYALFFIVTYHMFPSIDSSAPWTLARTCEHALAAAMLVMLAMDAWRLLLGPQGAHGPLPAP